MKFSGEKERGAERNRLDFGSDPMTPSPIVCSQMSIPLMHFHAVGEQYVSYCSPDGSMIIPTE